MALWVLALATAAGLAWSGWASAAGRGPRLPLGVDVGWVVQGSPAHVTLTPAEALEIRSTGAGLARVEFRTSPFAGATSAAFYQDYGQVLQNLAAQHVQVLGLLDYTTVPGGQAAWTVGGSSSTSVGGGNAYTQKFAATAGAIMRHYQGQVRYWEIWNEPNAWTKNDGGGRYAGGTFMYPNNYAALLQATYHEAVVVDHLPVTIISGGLLGGSYGGVYSAANSGANYLRQVFADWRAQHLRRYPLDAVGQHLYIAQGGAAGNLVTPAHVQEYLNWVHQVPVSFGMPWLPTFITEVGWSNRQVGFADQAQNLATALAVARATPFVRAVVWYNLRSSGGKQEYGLFTPGGAGTPALTAFQQGAPQWGRYPGVGGVIPAR